MEGMQAGFEVGVSFELRGEFLQYVAVADPGNRYYVVHTSNTLGAPHDDNHDEQGPGHYSETNT